MTTFYFIRHGEVENPQQVWYGRLSGYALSVVGRQQAHQAANYFSSKDIDAIYSSPLLRTEQTAEIIAKRLDTVLNYSDDLLEINSVMQGKKYSDLAAINYNIFASETNNIEAESIVSAARRIKNFLLEISQKNQVVIAVSHGDILMLLKLMHKSLELNNFNLRQQAGEYTHHCEVYKVLFENGEIKSLTSVFRPSVLK